MNLTSLQTLTAQFAMDLGQTRYTNYATIINEAQVQFALDTKCLFKDQAYSVVAGTPTYALPTDFMWEKKVTLNKTDANPVGGIRLEPISRFTLEFEARDHNWEDDSGDPTNYIIDPESARQQIRLYPSPIGVDAGTNNLILTYYPLPTALAVGTDVPLNGNLLLAQFHIGIACYAAWLLLGGEPSTPEMVEHREELFKQYQNKVTDGINLFGNTISEPLRLLGGRIWH